MICACCVSLFRKMTHREIDFAPGSHRPRPQYAPEVHLGQSPLHKRLQHPKMKRRQPPDAEEDALNYVPPVTLRSARQLQYFRHAAVNFEATFVSGGDDDDADDDLLSLAATQSSPLVAVRVPTAEEVHGAQSTSPTNTSRPKLFLPHTYDAWGGRHEKPAVGHGVTLPTRPSTASVRRGGADSSHTSKQRLYHADLAPTADDIHKAAALQADSTSPPPAYLLRPFHSSVPSQIPLFEGRDTQHAALLRATERDNMCRTIQREEEKKLLLKARVSQIHDPLPPDRKPHAPRGTFPIATKLARLQQRIAGNSASLSPRVGREFVAPTFVLPSSRRYGSNKFREAPRAQMAYEHEDDEVDSTAALLKFERAHPRAM
ncbi:Hypothetical protein, putative [Bodo saltans]|uniref:Uncharacterized protein n=1 Tax=Bodo saltans TaxID=75058 RepID=A0A0S4IT43_BODSA|nr:Hypothetical protein, putative [Bodo saltans]|eukprot:CUG06368.1 Hypothetical protein, putative [Bodo saltans]